MDTITHNERPYMTSHHYTLRFRSTPFSLFVHSTIKVRLRSAVYGSNGEVLAKVRTSQDGKIKISSDGNLLHNENGTAIAGDIRNSWAGVSTLQSLFIQEHNAVCDSLKKNYPDMNDEELYRHARLVTSAVIAKVHTIDWTVELLKTDTLLAGMRGNWYGLLGKKFKETFGHVGGSILGGLVGLKKPENHGVPYSLTEEFVSVYRMHPLLPDKLQLRDISATPGPNKSLPVIEEIHSIFTLHTLHHQGSSSPHRLTLAGVPLPFSGKPDPLLALLSIKFTAYHFVS
ncbi:alpha-dioxygenase 1-like [Vigna unguiculata]|uniref:alpha-dioxygenase 1-like n=1 Tax=Vigna unguiculata TaxID=3917 RepID=UPI0010167FCE|nr:alpha-dioxygenase 1-like [Vigna unguiculata]